MLLNAIVVLSACMVIGGVLSVAYMIQAEKAAKKQEPAGLNTLFRWMYERDKRLQSQSRRTRPPFLSTANASDRAGLPGLLVEGLCVVLLVLSPWLLLPRVDELPIGEGIDRVEGARHWVVFFAVGIGLIWALWRSSAATQAAYRADLQASTSIVEVATANKQVWLVESGLATDRFIKAIEQLAAVIVVGDKHEPNLTVRIEAIYALGRIARDTEKAAQTVFHVLSSYVKAEFPRVKEEDADAHTKSEVDGRDRAEWPITVRSDLKAVMTVIRNELKDLPEVGFDFSETDLRGVDLHYANLSGALLNGANLTNANLMGADLSRANLMGADFFRANLYSAKLNSVYLINVNLSRANLTLVDLSEAHLQFVDLSGALLGGADLEGAYLEGVIGWSTVKGKNMIRNLEKVKKLPS